MMGKRSSSGGFSVAELITVCVIIAILAAIALPVAAVSIRRQKEIELREHLRRITEAIDRYHDYRTATGPIQMKDPKDFQAGDYPKDMDALIKGIELTDNRKIRLLRDRDLIDPMTGKKEWLTLSNNNDGDATSWDHTNVFEVHSKSTALALDGVTHYNEW